MKPQWSLGAKLTLLGAPFLLLVLLSTAATLWVSWQLDGGAAAVNEAGRMRMQTYRMSLSVGQGQTASLLPAQIDEFDHSLALLRSGDPERPLFVPWDDAVRQRFAAVGRDWSVYRARWLDGRPMAHDELLAQSGAFVANIDALVIAIESHMARWTSLLYLLQISVLALTIVILGGMGNVAGAVVGSVLLIGLPEVFRIAAEYRVLIYGIVLLLLVRFRPQGLFGTV